MSDERESPESDEAPSAAEAKSAPAAAAREPTPAPKKKKKKKKEEDSAEESGAAPVLDDPPEGKSLKEAEAAFAIGDYQTARALAQKLAVSERPTIADAARDLLRRTDVDPAQMIFLAACACALLGVAFYYLR